MSFELYFRPFDESPELGDSAFFSRHYGFSPPADLAALWSHLGGRVFSLVNCVSRPSSVIPSDSFFQNGFYCSYVVPVRARDGQDSVFNLMLNTGSTLPTGYVPLVGDLGGNYVLAKVGHASMGDIRFWDHETDECFEAFADVRDFFLSLGPDVDCAQAELQESKDESLPVDLDIIFGRKKE